MWVAELRRVPMLVPILSLDPETHDDRQLLVRKRGFEPLRSCERQPLKLVRLPVPPLPLARSLKYSSQIGWCVC